MSKAVIPCLTFGETAMRLAAIKDRPRSEFWLIRFGTRHCDPQPPRIDATWDEIRTLVAHCLTVRDAWAVLSHLGAVKIERQALPPVWRPLVCLVATVPVVGGWKARVELELDPAKASQWEAAVNLVNQPAPAAQLQLF